MRWSGVKGRKIVSKTGENHARVLWTDGIEEFAASRKTELGDVEEECASHSEASVDLVGTVHVGVIDHYSEQKVSAR